MNYRLREQSLISALSDDRSTKRSSVNHRGLVDRENNDRSAEGTSMNDGRLDDSNNASDYDCGTKRSAVYNCLAMDS